MMKINQYALDFTKEAERDYMKLPLKDKRNVIRKIKENYLNGNIRNVSPLKEHKLLKRLKVGNYRVVIYLNSKTEHVIYMIGDRKEVYLRVKRKGVKFV